MSTTNSEGESGIFLIILFFVGCLLSIISALLPKEIPGFRSFFAPAFVICSSVFLAFEYIGIQLEVGGFIGGTLAIYHGLTVYVLFILWRSTNVVSKRISDNHLTPMKEILIATLLTSIVFIATHYLTEWDEISWAFPITMSLFFWQLFEKLTRSF